MKNKTKEDQLKVYKNLYEKYKGSPMAVSSESLNHKKLRFNKLSGIFQNENNISVHDVGMGLADFGIFLNRNFSEKNIEYSGSDILNDYVDEAKQKFPDSNFFCRDIAETLPKDKYDFIVLSGVFHQMRSSSIIDWENFSEMILENSFKMCKKGIAFNMVSPFVDFYQAGIYYSKIEKLIHFINSKLSRFFTINHDYALYEFTVYIFKEEYIKQKFQEPEFKKYFD
tara:strand:- start:1231 stop:1908 length:678 start_codon:yes stop_codon:yes gene_type:complete